MCERTQITTKMHKLFPILIITHILIAIPYITTSNANNTEKSAAIPHSEHNDIKKIVPQHRERRSLEEYDKKPFWANRGKRYASGRTMSNDESDSRVMETMPILEESRNSYGEKSIRQDGPFWGNRGRRGDSSAMEVRQGEFDVPVWPSRGRRELIEINVLKKIINKNTEKNNRLYSFPEDVFENKERREDETNPFWGNRGRRNSDENFGLEDESPFSGIHGRNDNDSPFWEARERRDEMSPFWGARGRRDDESPFWGARGRRDENSPFWGSRGRRNEETPFWGNRGRREETGPFWGNRGRRYDQDMVNNNFDALKNIKDELNGVSRYKRNPFDLVSHIFKGQRDHDTTSFWKNRGRNSELKYLFMNTQLNKAKTQRLKSSGHKFPDFTGLKSLRQDKLYVDEPYFILIDRSSRSISTDDDPYFISRGKKKIDLAKAVRDRRGIMEQIAKSVQQDDPYFVTRGKKDVKQDINAKTNITEVRYDEFVKTRELICSAIEMMNSKIKEDSNVRRRRELSDRDRNRRAILKKLAAQLENDPYFVSRGKKNINFDFEGDKLQKFIQHVTDMCS